MGTVADYTLILIPLLLFAPALSTWLASRKGRSWVEGLLLGLLLTWVGVAIEAALPPRPRDAGSGSPSST